MSKLVLVLFNRLTGAAVRPVEVDATEATSGVLAGPMLDMVLWAMRDFLAVDLHGAMAVFAAYVFAGCVSGFCYRNFLPPPFVLAVYQVFASLLTVQHLVVWHV